MKKHELEVGKKYIVACNQLGDHSFEIGAVVEYMGEGRGNGSPKAELDRVSRFPEKSTIFKDENGNLDWLIPAEVKEMDGEQHE